MAFVNCDDNKKFCKENGPKDLPALKMFPPVPIPTQEFGMDLKKAINSSVRYVKNYVKVVDNDAF